MRLIRIVSWIEQPPCTHIDTKWYCTYKNLYIVDKGTQKSCDQRRKTIDMKMASNKHWNYRKRVLSDLVQLHWCQISKRFASKISAQVEEAEVWKKPRKNLFTYHWETIITKLMQCRGEFDKFEWFIDITKYFKNVRVLRKHRKSSSVKERESAEISWKIGCKVISVFLNGVSRSPPKIHVWINGLPNHPNRLV